MVFGHVLRDRPSPGFQLGVFSLLDRPDSIEVSLPDRQAIGIGLGDPQFRQRELLARIDEAVDRDPSFLKVGMLGVVTPGVRLRVTAGRGD